MKKYFYPVLAAGMLFATSCSQDQELVDVTKGEGQIKTITVELPSIESRAIAYGDGSVEVGKGIMVNKLVYAMYEEDKRDGKPLVTNFADRQDDGKFKINVPMAKKLKYDLLFLAYNVDEPIFDIKGKPADQINLNALTLRPDLKANQESYDAFVGVLDSHGIQDSHSITLTRPFAQVNAVTTLADLEAVKVLKSNVTTSKLVISAPNTYNVFSGAATGNVPLTYDASAILQDIDLANKADAYPKNEKFNTEYYYLTLAYVLAGDNPNAPSSNHNAKFEFYRENGDPVSKLDILSLPLQRNYRTNVMGDLLTKSENYTVSIDAKFGEKDNNVALPWDGKTLKEPAYDETTQTYFIYNASELAYIAALVNGTLDTDNVSRTAVSKDDLSGKTITLMDDIYLNNVEWSPIGHGSNHFCGTLEGNNKTIYGLKITQRGDTRAALFGTVSLKVAFRNLTIKGASIECPDFNGDFYGSALIGTAYGNVTIENVDVVNSYISGNNKVGALLAHDGVVSSLKIHGCDVSEVTFEATNSADGGSVGGLVGYFQGAAGGEYKIENCTVENSVFNVVNSTNTGKRANGLLMGGLGVKDGQNLYITNCTTDKITWNEKFYIDGEEVTSDTDKFVSPFDGWIGGERNDYAEIKGEVWIDGVKYPYIPQPVAKVGNTEYYSIDEAIADWENNTTLTLIDNVTLSDVITLKSTEHHILDLGTYTMTAASGKNAFVIQACGTGDAERSTITIKADASNPGGINAGNKSIIYYKYADGGISGNDRPIIKIEGGVFTGSTSSFGTAGIYTIGKAARQCATINISGGIFNCSINGSGKSKLLISGGVFHYSVGSQGDSTAYRLISGGTFKTFGFMTADSNNTKFWFGTKMATSDIGLYINDDNYLVVGGPVITEFGDKFAAKATNPTKWHAYLQYSSAAANGLYYTNADLAIKNHGETNVVLP